MYGFKLEGGEWFKEGFCKLLSQEWNYFEKHLNQNSVCQNTKQISTALEKQSVVSTSSQISKLNLKRLRIERMHTKVYTGSF